MTASLLPLPRFVAYDVTGQALAGGFVYPLNPATMLPSITWQDAGQTIPNTHPIVLDSSGSALIYADGQLWLNTTNSIGDAVPGYSGLTDDGSARFVTIASLANNTSEPSGSCLTGYFHNVPGFASRFVCDRLFDRVSSLDFGADPSGVVDCTASFQNAIGYLQSIGGGTLWITPGTYNITGVLNITASGVVIRGDNQGACILSFANGANDCIHIGYGATPLSGVEIQDITLRGVGKSAGQAIACQNIVDSTFAHITIDGQVDGVYFSTVSRIVCDSLDITLTGAAATAHCIYVYSPADATHLTEQVSIRDCRLVGTSCVGISIDGRVSQTFITNTTIYNVGWGLRIDNSAQSATYYPTGVFAQGLYVENCTQSCLDVRAGAHQRFVNCIFNISGTNCVEIAPDPAASLTNDISLVSCQITGAQIDGVLIVAKNINIIGCMVAQNSLVGLNAHGGISVFNAGGVYPSTDINIIGNFFTFPGATNNQGIAISIAPACDRINIIGNNFMGINFQSIYDGSSNNRAVAWSDNRDLTGEPMPNRIAILNGDPPLPALPFQNEGAMWFNATAGTIRVLTGGVMRTINTTP